eukprot:c49130_g1_i1 orf=3-182(-)
MTDAIAPIFGQSCGIKDPSTPLHLCYLLVSAESKAWGVTRFPSVNRHHKEHFLCRDGEAQ